MKTIFISVEEYLRNKGELHGREAIYDINESIIGWFKSFDLNDLNYIVIQGHEEFKKERQFAFVEIEVTPIYIAV